MDDASPKKDTRSTENAKTSGLRWGGAHRWSMPDPSITLHLIRHDVLRCILKYLMVIISQNKVLASWGRTFCVLCYDKFYIHAVKTKVDLIYTLSAQRLSNPQSITIWPTIAQLFHSDALWHDWQPGFHETHLKLSIDRKGDQETRHNCDRNC